MNCHCNDKTKLTYTMNIGKYHEKEAGNINILFLVIMPHSPHPNPLMPFMVYQVTQNKVNVPDVMN